MSLNDGKKFLIFFGVTPVFMLGLHHALHISAAR
jgi:hypothetical protein